ncbi:hypothetical protein V8F06_002279 [Rhypophila decipiens]
MKASFASLPFISTRLQPSSSLLFLCEFFWQSAAAWLAYGGAHAGWFHRTTQAKNAKARWGLLHLQYMDQDLDIPYVRQKQVICLCVFALPIHPFGHSPTPRHSSFLSTTH